ncbi:unnamed protein product [Prunus armeniaca]
MANEDLVSWNAILSGYSQEGNHGLEAIFVFIEMVGEGMGKLVEEGEMIHGFCIKTGFLSKHNVCNSLITMYTKFDSIHDSIKNGLCQDALKTFLVATMESKPNNYTFGSVLSAIGTVLVHDIYPPEGSRERADELTNNAAEYARLWIGRGKRAAGQGKMLRNDIN